MGPISQTINYLFSLYYVLLIARAVLPWLPHDRQNPLVRFLDRLTDPVINPIRLGLPPEKIGFDVSPFVAIVLLWLLQGFIIVFLIGGIR